MLKIDSDKVIYKFGEKAQISIRIENTSEIEIRGDLYIELKINGYVKSAVLFRENLVVKPNAVYMENYKLALPREEGIGRIDIYLENFEGKILSDSIVFGIIEPKTREPLYVAFVWHHHQAPNFYPNGVFHSPWAFIHTYSSEFYPAFKSGAYHLHIENHKKHLKIKDVDHLSPSLLLQWKKAITDGVKLEREYMGPESSQVLVIKKVLLNFKEFVKKGNIEPLGDLFAHTVQGFVIDIFSRHGMKTFILELLDWELKYGRKLVEDILDHKPLGAWTPEMYWCKELIRLYAKNGYKYTVLCDQHFEASSGEKGTIYEPYMVEDSENRLIIFFRDRELSDWISFGNNFENEDHAKREARAFILALLKRYLENPGGICVIALDGENWMLGSKTRKYIPIFFDLLWKYLEDNEDMFKTLTLREYLEEQKPRYFKKLKYIPQGSWVGLSASPWKGGIKNELWKFVIEKAKWVAALSYALPRDIKEKMITDEDSLLFQAYKALAIAIDSDYFWYGDRELEKKVIKTWAEEAERISQELLKKVKLQSVSIADDTVTVAVKNETEYPIRILLKFKDTTEEYIQLQLESKSLRVITYKVKKEAKAVVLLIPPVVLKEIDFR